MRSERKLTVTKPGESWGEPGARTHQQDSELVAHERAGWVTFSVKQGAVNKYGADPEKGAEAVAAISITYEDAHTLGAFLLSLPKEL